MEQVSWPTEATESERVRFLAARAPGRYHPKMDVTRIKSAWFPPCEWYWANLSR